jgi:DNA-directed RNA polymerase specialized sigma24 family protein
MARLRPLEAAGSHHQARPASGYGGYQAGRAAQHERAAVIAALRDLPERDRQALVLRYYADLSEAQIADIMGITRSAVKRHTTRGMSSLRTVLEQTTRLADGHR